MKLNLYSKIHLGLFPASFIEYHKFVQCLLGHSAIFVFVKSFSISNLYLTARIYQSQDNK
ncbi:hypothetical protein IX53_09130 [Kosmotoga pacifica]|uniref:Uncharacterized protein n=1 Tax=Kosmotoga pacifica TaxID=1330330 RepID=A0A0G2ZGT9_9BACT|nr:hypothetical protein IX53_09130 [Kosmotoga pacifica]